MKKIFLVLVSVLLVSPLFAGVMMQGFYWDVPSGGTWYNTMKSKAHSLRYMAGGEGINRMYFPAPSKGQGGGYSMGYDPYDYYDLGNYDQMGDKQTRFGSKSELKAAIAEYKSYGIVSMADIVLNHRSGGASESNPRKGGKTWTDFRGVKSGKMKWRWDAFHPNNYHWSDEGAFGGYPDVCHSAGPAYNDFKTWLKWLKSTANAGFTGGWRFDYVKGFAPWVAKDMKAATGNVFTVGEYWDSSTSTLNWWANNANSSVFDFATYYTLKDICNNSGGGGYLPNLFNPNKSFASKWDARAVTFVGNHDTDEIYNDKMMAYAFILTYKGYPCISWKDYFNYGLASGGGAGSGWGNGIKQLVWVREKLAAGGPKIEILKSNNGDVIIYGSKGYSSSAPGYIVVINDNKYNWKGAWVKTGNGYLKNKTLKAYAWSSSRSGQNYKPDNKYCDGNGNVEVWAAPRGYAVYSVKGF